MALVSRTRISLSDSETEESGLDEFRPETQESLPVREFSAPSGAIRSGWSAPKTAFTKTVKPSGYVNLKDCKKHIVKILEEEPTVNYLIHWIASVRKTVTCLGEGCPLCAEGLKTSERMIFSAVDMTDRSEVKMFQLGSEIGGKLLSSTEGPEDDRGKPTYIPVNHPDRYFMVQRIDGNRTSYDVTPVKARDLEEDWRLKPLTSKELAELSKTSYGRETLWIDTHNKVQELANHLTDSDLR